GGEGGEGGGGADRGPGGVPGGGETAGAGRPVDGVVAGERGDPAGDQPQREERARQEGQRQHQRGGRADERLPLAVQQPEGDGDVGHRQRDQDRDADQRGDVRRGPDIDRTTYKATSIDILAPPSTLTAA